jgi:hypothetical protein
VFGLSVRLTGPLAIMPSANQVPVKSSHSTTKPEEGLARRRHKQTSHDGGDGKVRPCARPSAVGYDTASNAGHTTAVLWIVGVVVTTGMNDERATAYIVERKIWRGDNCVHAFVGCRQEWQVAPVAIADRTFVRFCFGRIVVAAGGETGPLFSILHARTTIAFFMQMKAMLTRAGCR